MKCPQCQINNSMDASLELVDQEVAPGVFRKVTVHVWRCDTCPHWHEDPALAELNAMHRRVAAEEYNKQQQAKVHRANLADAWDRLDHTAKRLQATQATEISSAIESLERARQDFERVLIEQLRREML